MDRAYFEGVMQIRNANEKVMDFIISRFEKNEVDIAKIVKVKDGFDLYSSSNKFSRKLGKMLVKEFGGELKETARLFTKNRLTSKDVYRLTVYYKVPEIKKNDVVVIRGKVIQVTCLKKNFVKGIDLETNSRVTLPVIEPEFLEKKKTQVIKVKPVLEVMHPDTYQPVVVENQKHLKISQNVEVVMHKNKLFVL